MLTKHEDALGLLLLIPPCSRAYTFKRLGVHAVMGDRMLKMAPDRPGYVECQDGQK